MRPSYECLEAECIVRGRKSDIMTSHSTGGGRRVELHELLRIQNGWEVPKVLEDMSSSRLWGISDALPLLLGI